MLITSYSPRSCATGMTNTTVSGGEDIVGALQACMQFIVFCKNTEKLNAQNTREWNWFRQN